jgi:hypothetical protein
MGVFTYFYRYFYNNCNQLVKIKTKHGKTKHVVKPKIMLSLSYFLLLILIYYNFTYKIFVFIFSIILLAALNGFEQFYFKSTHFIYKYDNNKAIRISWKMFSSTITLFFLIYNPMFKVIDSYINDKKILIQSIISKNLSFTNKTDNNKPLEKNIDINKSKQSNNSSHSRKSSRIDSSEIFDYIVKSSKKDDSLPNLNIKENKNINSTIFNEENSNLREQTIKETTEKSFEQSSIDQEFTNTNITEALSDVVSNKDDNNDIIANFKSVNNLLNSNNCDDIEDITITDHNN